MKPKSLRQKTVKDKELLFCRCQALTRLKLSNETLLDPVGENVILLNLTEAHFEDGLMTPDWLNSFNMAAPRLQLLRVQRMICTAALAGEKLNPFTNLRQALFLPSFVLEIRLPWQI